MAFEFVNPSADPGTLAGPLSLPPITNRGAEITITIPPCNRSLIDWASFTLKTSNPQEVAGLLGLDPSLFSPFSFGFSGYRKSLRFGNISIFYEGREDMGCHVEMSGQGCRHYEGLFSGNPWGALFRSVLDSQGKFTRLDLALDTVDGSLPLDRLCAAVQDPENQIRTLFGEWRRIVKGSFRQGEGITGETLYLGSSKSHVLFRIYNKAQEVGIKGDWVRFELQLRDKRAQEAVRHMGSSSLGAVAVGIVNNYFAIVNADDSNVSRRTLQGWWADWLQSTGKISLSTEQAVKFVADTMEFIKRQYAPSLAMIKQHLGAQPFKTFVGELLEDGRERMSAKHERMLSASAGGRGKSKASQELPEDQS